MKETLVLERGQAEQDLRISETVEREQARLRNFIRRRVADQRDAEDILQEVFYEFVAAYRLMKPIEQVSGWLFRVARNRIIDLFRRKKPGSLSDPVAMGDDGEELLLEASVRVAFISGGRARPIPKPLRIAMRADQEPAQS